MCNYIKKAQINKHSVLNKINLQKLVIDSKSTSLNLSDDVRCYGDWPNILRAMLLFFCVALIMP